MLRQLLGLSAPSPSVIARRTLPQTSTKLPTTTTKMSSNLAAWITGPRATPLVVKDAPFPAPGPKEVVVKNAAVAINPLEFHIQDANPPIGGKPIVYPMILGADLAGTIHSVGADVSAFKPADRVIANGAGYASGEPHKSAFQLYTVVPEAVVIPIPATLAFEEAVVLPLACHTAMAGLFAPDQLALSTAELGDAESAPPSPGSAVLVWGGSSSVGCCAIQMARRAGYEVYALASTRNHALCGSLGAKRVFDYSQPNLEDSVVEALRGRKVVGALDCIADAEKTIPSCARIVSRTDGRKKVVTVLTPPGTEFAEGVEVQRLSIPALMGTRTLDVVHAWIKAALADGSLQAKPEPRVVGQGLDSVQLGIDTVRTGVSATKVVIRL